MISQFEMTHLGLMSYFLGIEVSQLDNGIFISQKKYTGDILKRFNMDNAKPILTPVEEKLKLVRDGTGDFVDATYFRKLLGSLRYLTSTRPDITYGVGLISRFMETLRQFHLQEAKRILRYIQGTQTDGIFYAKTNDSSLVGFTDSDWVGDTIQRKSTSGHAFYLGSGVFSWSSKKQQVVALSTAEAEYMEATSSSIQALWLRRMLGFLQHKQDNPTIFFVIANKEIVIEYCKTGEQVTDVFTKPLKLELFIKLKKMLGMIKFEDLSLREAVGN
ncbi:uncharacterized mitochondrial protein AtMg00810-like [Nicotiana tomentosiformis]|uniref:uncharacterized mitochondrial protein AtMg00810-like n=1 Tax=Nicotiana tomentosiformis TaxID=4098 RepID=UPI00388C3BCB